MQGVIISKKCGKIDGKIIPANFAVIIGKQKNEKNNAEDAHHQKIQNKFYAEKCIKKLRQIEQRTECKAEKCKGN